MKILKAIIALALLTIAMVLISLPGSAEKQYDVLSEYQSIPDFDFRTESQKLWDSGEQEAALLLLEEIISNYWPDKAAAEQLYRHFGEEIKKRESSLGRIKAFGSSFVTGKVNSFEELAGASLADFFIYGDIRDLTRELVFEDDANNFIVALSGLGLLTSLFPPADPLASLLKTSYKSGSLTEPMTKHIQKVLEPLKNGTRSVSLATLKGIVNQLKPIWTLAGKCKSWQHFSLFMKHCKNTKQVKFLINILSTAGNSKKLAAILSSMKNLPKQSANSLEYIHKFGQKGMDSLYAVLRKGPKGIQFLLKNPKLYSRLGKNAVKTAGLSTNLLKKKWTELLKEYGMPLNIARYALATFCLIALKFLFFPKRNSAPKEEIIESKEPKSSLLIWSSVFLFIVLFISILSNGNTADESFLSISPTASGSIKASSIIFFLVFTAVQIWSVFKAKNEIDEIQKVSQENKKIKLLENCEFYFDLPVYTGLAGTVCAFILLNFDPGGSRVLAYATTVSGILISVYLRGKWLFPMKKEIIHGESHE